MMTTFSWKTSASGQWSSAASWSPSGPPNATSADAVIAVGGAYSATLDYGGTFAVNTLRLASSGATLLLNGTLNFSGARALTISAGTLRLAGTVRGAIVSMTGGTIQYAGGTLDAVTYRGTLDLSTAASTLYVRNGLTLQGSTGSGAGAVKIGSATVNSTLYVLSSSTLNNATVTLSSGSLYNYDTTGTGQTLTLGSSLVLQHGDGYGNVYAGSSAGDTLVNQGRIAASSSSGKYLQIYGARFINQGTISVSNGDTLLESATTFSNTGTVLVNAGTLQLGGSLSSLSGISSSNGGVVRLTGLLNNAGHSVSIGTGTALGKLTLSGTITGGLIADAGQGLIAAYGTLDGVTLRGTLDLSTASSVLFVRNGLTLQGSTGSGAGAVKIGSATVNSTLYVLSSSTLNNATVTLSSGSLYNNDTPGTGQTLTLGSSLVLQHGTGYANVYAGAYAGDRLINSGRISASVAGGTYLQIYGNSFTNQGTISISNGDTLLENAATFSNTGKIYVSAATLQLGGTLTSLSGISVSNAGTVRLTGLLNNAGHSIAIGTGTSIATLTLQGTISGGVVNDSGRGLVGTSGTLDGVTYRGTLDLGAVSSTLYVRNGLALQGAGGTGAGAIKIGSSIANSTVYVLSSTTLNNATITATSGQLYNYDTTGTGQTLTLGSSLVAQHGAGYANIYAGGYAADTLVNAGRIVASSSGGTYLQVYGNRFSNTGTISVSNGDTLLENAATFSNTGKIYVSAATLQLGGTLTSLSGISVSNAGTVRLTGLLNNAGHSIAIGTGTSIATLTLQGTISGGVVNDSGRGLVGTSGTLDGVTYRGTLDLGAVSSTLYVRNGLALQGAGGTGAGAIKIGSSIANSTVYVLSSTTLNNATITATSGQLYNYDTTGTGQTLTLGSSLVAQHGTGYANIYAGGYAGDRLINSGRIVASSSGGTYLQIYGSSFSNYGTISVSNGDTLLLNPTIFTNLSGTTLTGGSYEVGASTTLQLKDNATVGTLAANITLTGGGSAIQSRNSMTGTQVRLESMLSTISSSGALRLLGNRGYTTSKTVTDNGGLVLNGGTFASAGTLTVGSTGTLLGFGTVKPPVANAGRVEANGGTLVLAGSVTGTGALQADATSTLLLKATAPSSITGRVTLNGAGSQIRFGTTSSSQGLETSVTSVGSTGTLSVLGGRGYSSTKALAVSGRLVVAGGTVSLGSLSVAAGGRITGYGVLTNTFVNSGTVDASGGLLRLAGTVSGSGTLQIENAATLELAAGAQAVTFATGATATLKLDTASKFTGAIRGITTGDAITFGNETVSSAVVSGTTLTVVGSAGTTKYQVAGSLSGNHFAVQSDAHTIKLVAGAALQLASPTFMATTRAGASEAAPAPWADGGSQRPPAAIGIGSGAVLPPTLSPSGGVFALATVQPEPWLVLSHH